LKQGRTSVTDAACVGTPEQQPAVRSWREPEPCF